MKNSFFILFSLTIFISCHPKSELNTVLNCKSPSFSNLEIVTDVKKQFSILLPQNWKTNLYFDEAQSSIYAADTTLQLTKTILLDISYIKDSLQFDLNFKKKRYLQHYKEGLNETLSKEIIILNLPAYITLSKGKKGKFLYQIAEIFIKTTPQNFLFIKSEIYGDSLVNERFCKSFKLIEKIKLK